ncbi:MAG TPA: lyase family protein, partial [Nocardioides sp.]|nr:lyase family protein [Nocardioides sp.]
MSDDFWPGDHRAGDHFTQDTFREAMTAVEVVWLAALVRHGIAPASAEVDLGDLLEPDHEDYLAEETDAGGNPVIGLVSLLRSALEDEEPDAARWLHRGLTSQDVLDTAIMLMAQDAVGQLQSEIRGQAERLAALAMKHRGTVMVARTLTQHAVPTTFGLKVAQWLTGVLDAYDGLAALSFPVQIGGAAGTGAAVAELGADPTTLIAEVGQELGLDPAVPWHTVRTPITRLADALVACTDAWGHLASDVLILSRPEIGELSEGSGGGSSTMPDKHNPVLSVLIRRTAITTPQLAATLHLTAALQVDERADGAWHAEWATLRDLVRRTLVAASHAFDLAAELQVHTDRMTQTLGSARGTVLAEQRTMAELAGHTPMAAYVGEAGT